MSALLILLTATMAVPADEAKKPSEKEERKLDLKGEWKGSLRIEAGFTVPATYQDGKLTAMRPGGPETAAFVLIDQGEGKCRCRIGGDDKDLFGIYKWNKQQLVLHIGKHWQRPTSFEDEDVLVLTIKPVKPRK